MITICPMILDNTFFETSDAVGRFGKIRGYGSVRPTTSSVNHQVNKSSSQQFAGRIKVRVLAGKRIKAMPRQKAPPQSVQIHPRDELKKKRTCDCDGDDNEQIDVQKLFILVNKGCTRLVGMK